MNQESCPPSRAPLLLAGAAVFALSLWFLAGAGSGAADSQPLVWKPILPAAEFKELVGRAVKSIQQDLATGKTDEDTIKRIQNHAAQVAAYAQSVKDGIDPQQLATLRDAAVRLHEMVTYKDKLPGAKQLAASLTKLEADAKADVKPIALQKLFQERGDVMVPFKTTLHGGEGLPEVLQSSPELKSKIGNSIERKIGELADPGKKLTPAQLAKQSEELVLLAYQTAVLANLAREWVPDRKEGRKDPKDWLAWSQDMHDRALDLAAAVKGKDPQAVRKAADKLDSACKQCHSVFRE
jgi:cytochrome c556